MPLILCIETATKLCSVALVRDGVVLAQRDLESEQHIHAEKVNVFIGEVMQEASVPLKDLNAVAVGIGPGSYTGLRIGLSVAKGLCYALEIPIIGISTLGTLFSAARNRNVITTPCWPMIDARRMEVFTQGYGPDGTALNAAAPLVLDDAWAVGAGAVAVFGDGAEKATAIWDTATNINVISGIRPTAAAMMEEALRRYTIEQFDDLAYLVPDYGKAANVSQPKKRDGQ